MAKKIEWYLYNGNVPVPVGLPNGNTVIVPPRGVVPTIAPLAAKVPGLKRTAAPSDAEQRLALLMLEVPVKVPKKFAKSEQAEHLVENPGEAPKPGRKVKIKGKDAPAEAPPVE